MPKCLLVKAVDLLLSKNKISWSQHHPVPLTCSSQPPPKKNKKTTQAKRVRECRERMKENNPEKYELILEESKKFEQRISEEHNR